ncbi:MAG: MoaD/ThiS family protein [Acidobacteria bacterium]|nr:MoaD/ThiS family protein [Acidobacteriota bacterium]MBK8147033.1 MoaD/ThiS family protein [Acidobacteriota bacterium]
MKLVALFFGATADAVGEREVEIEVQADASAGDAVDEVVGRFPALRGQSLLFAVNQEYVGRETPVADGDELAIFTAVSGG